jgi:ribosomal protein S18 acetylase RimI-like enzyme
MSISIIPISKEDENVLSEICFITSFVYPDESQKDLLNWKWLKPYCRIETQNCFKAVSDKNDEIAGYILSTLDSLDFEKKCKLMFNKQLEDLSETFLRNHTLSESQLKEFNDHFSYSISDINDPDYIIKKEYPAHLHINVLPDYQREGLGHKLIDRLLTHLQQNNCSGLHLGVGAKNLKGIQFYKKYGFKDLQIDIEGAIIFGLKL